MKQSVDAYKQIPIFCFVPGDSIAKRLSSLQKSQIACRFEYDSAGFNSGFYYFILLINIIFIIV